MRAINSSSRLLCLLLVVSSACATTTVVDRTTVRGRYLRREASAPVNEDKPILEVKDGQATVKIERRQCTDTLYVYAQVEKQKTLTEKRSVGPIVAGLVVLAAGAAGVAAVQTANISEEVKTPTTLVPALLGGGVGLGLLLFGGSDLEEGTQEEELPTKERKLIKECTDETLDLKRELPFTFSMEGGSTSGVSDAQGRVQLKDAVMQVLDRVQDDDRVLKRLLSDKSMSYQLKLGQAPRVNGSLPTKSLPDAFFARVADRLESQLSGNDKLAWENCKALGRSSREWLECHFSR